MKWQSMRFCADCGALLPPLMIDNTGPELSVSWSSLCVECQEYRRRQVQQGEGIDVGPFRPRLRPEPQAKVRE